MEIARRALGALLELLYPRTARCMGCGSVRGASRESMLCARCAETLAPAPMGTCGVCGHDWFGERVAWLCPECQAMKRAGLSFACGALCFEGAAREVVHAFKFEGVFALAAPMARDMVPMYECLAAQGFEADVLVPVPMHRARMRARGYNQSQKLAQALARQIHVPVCAAISRTRNTRPQTTLDSAGRRGNVRGAFAPTRSLDGKNVLLIDDVLTTGATICACAQAVFEAGAARVGALCYAHAGGNRADGV